MNESEIKYLDFFPRAFRHPAAAAEIDAAAGHSGTAKNDPSTSLGDIGSIHTSHILKAPPARSTTDQRGFGDLLSGEEKNSNSLTAHYPERACRLCTRFWYRVTIHHLVARPVPGRRRTNIPASRLRPSAEGICLYYRGLVVAPTSTVPTSADILKASSTA